MGEQEITRRELDERIYSQIDMLEVLSACLENDNDDDYLKLSPPARRGMIKIISDLKEDIYDLEGKIREHFPSR